MVVKGRLLSPLSFKSALNDYLGSVIKGPIASKPPKGRKPSKLSVPTFRKPKGQLQLIPPGLSHVFTLYVNIGVKGRF